MGQASNGQTLKTTDTMELLKRRMELKPVRNTKLISITVYSDDKKECAVLANGMAEAYRDYRQDQRLSLTSGGLKALQEDLAVNEAKIKTAATNMEYLRRILKITDNDPNAMNPSPTLTSDMLRAYDEQRIEQERTCKALESQLNGLKASGHQPSCGKFSRP